MNFMQDFLQREDIIVISDIWMTIYYLEINQELGEPDE